MVYKRAHRLFAHVTLMYLVSIVEKRKSLAEASPVRHNPVRHNSRFLYAKSEFPLLRYAIDSWYHHLPLAETENSDSTEWALTKRLFDPVLHSIYIGIHSRRRPRKYNILLALHLDRHSIDGVPYRQDISTDIRLYQASLLGLGELVECLLREGENPNTSTDRVYGYPLIAAASRGHEAVVKLLVNFGAKVDVKVFSVRSTALYFAARHGRTEIMKLLLESGLSVNEQNKLGETALHAAASSGQVAAIQLLLENGADINVADENQECPLYSAVIRCNLSAVRQLLKHGADINQKGGRYGYALQAAAVGRNLEMVRYLVEEGADVNANGGIHGSALQATSIIMPFPSKENCMAIARFLLDRGANVNATGGKWGSALRAARAIGAQDIIDLLLEYGASDEFEVVISNLTMELTFTGHGTTGE